MLTVSKALDYVGTEFEANGMEAFDNDGTKTTLGATWVVMDYDSTERGSFFLLAPKAIQESPWSERDDVTDMFVTADPYDVIQRIDPELYAGIRRWEDGLAQAEADES